MPAIQLGLVERLGTDIEPCGIPLACGICRRKQAERGVGGNDLILIK